MSDKDEAYRLRGEEIDFQEGVIKELEQRIEELEKPVEDGEVKEILRSLRVSWDGFGKTVLKESPAADLIESQQATITELKYFAQSIIDHDWHYDSLDDAVRFARAALKESE